MANFGHPHEQGTGEQAARARKQELMRGNRNGRLLQQLRDRGHEPSFWRTVTRAIRRGVRRLRGTSA